MRVWDAITGIEMLPPLRGHDDSIHSVAFFPDSIVAPMPESFHLKVVSPPDQARSRLGVLSSIMTENPPILGVFVPDPHLLPAVTTIQCHNPWPRVLAAQLDGSKGKRLSVISSTKVTSRGATHRHEGCQAASSSLKCNDAEVI